MYSNITPPNIIPNSNTNSSLVKSLAMTGDIRMNNHSIVDLAGPVNDTDAATKFYVDSHSVTVYGTETTSLTITSTTGTSLIVEDSTDVDIFGFNSSVYFNGGVIVNKGLYVNGPFITSADSGAVGSVQLVSGSATVTNSKLTTLSCIFLTVQDPINPGTVYISNKIPGVSFDITSSSVTDGSTVSYFIVEQGQSICFHGESTVFTKNSGIIKIKDLVHGSEVLSMDNDGSIVYSKILTFSGFFPNSSGKSIKVTFQSGSISLSYEHLLYVKKKDGLFKFIRACDIQAGDYLMKCNGVSQVYSVIPEDHLIGWYTPLTENSTIIVNGIVASCHTGSTDGLSRLFNGHDFSKVVYSPIKWFYKIWPYEKGSKVLNGCHWFSIGIKRLSWIW